VGVTWVRTAGLSEEFLAGLQELSDSVLGVLLTSELLFSSDYNMSQHHWRLQ